MNINNENIGNNIINENKENFNEDINVIDDNEIESKYKNKVDIFENENINSINSDFHDINKENYFKEFVEDDTEVLYQKNNTLINDFQTNSINTDNKRVNLKECESSKNNVKFSDIIKKQEEILQETESCKEKINLFNEIALNQINEFNKNSKKYGMFLNMIKNDMFAVDDLIKKINNELNKKYKKTDLDK